MNGAFWQAGDSQGKQMGRFGGLGIPKVGEWWDLVGLGVVLEEEVGKRPFCLES